MLAIQEVEIPATEVLVSSFKPFSEAIGPLLHIHSDYIYKVALDRLEELLESAPENPDAPEHELIEMIAHAVERYEDSLPEVQAWQAKVDGLDPALSTLRLLMDQHNLTGSDFKDEIGGKSYVSQILSGTKSLTRRHIENLIVRFNISPDLFF